MHLPPLCKWLNSSHHTATSATSRQLIGRRSSSGSDSRSSLRSPSSCCSGESDSRPKRFHWAMGIAGGVEPVVTGAVVLLAILLLLQLLVPRRRRRRTSSLGSASRHDRQHRLVVLVPRRSGDSNTTPQLLLPPSPPKEETRKAILLVLLPANHPVLSRLSSWGRRGGKDDPINCFCSPFVFIYLSICLFLVSVYLSIVNVSACCNSFCVSFGYSACAVSRRREGSCAADPPRHLPHEMWPSEKHVRRSKRGLLARRRKAYKRDG